MLNQEQQQAKVTITAGAAVVALQVISRLSGLGALKDVELAPVGTQRDVIVQALEEATGVNYDAARAQAEAIQRQRVAEARAAQEKAQREAAETASADADQDVADAAVADAVVAKSATTKVKAKSKSKRSKKKANTRATA
jgi:hypothetical protein